VGKNSQLKREKVRRGKEVPSRLWIGGGSILTLKKGDVTEKSGKWKDGEDVAGNRGGTAASHKCQ